MLGVAFQNRFNAAVELLKRTVDAGRFGCWYQYGCVGVERRSITTKDGEVPGHSMVE